MILILSVLVNGGPIVLEAVKGLAERRMNVDELVSIAIVACMLNGNYLEGRAAVQESSLTGEPVPVAKQPCDAVYGGTVAVEGFIRVRALKLGEDSTIGKIIKMVQAAEQSKTRGAKIVDRYAAWFTPVMGAVVHNIGSVLVVALAASIRFKRDDAGAA